MVLSEFASSKLMLEIWRWRGMLKELAARTPLTHTRPVTNKRLGFIDQDGPRLPLRKQYIPMAAILWLCHLYGKRFIHYVFSSRNKPDRKFSWLSVGPKHTSSCILLLYIGAAINIGAENKTKLMTRRLGNKHALATWLTTRFCCISNPALFGRTYCITTKLDFWSRMAETVAFFHVDKSCLDVRLHHPICYAKYCSLQHL